MKIVFEKVIIDQLLSKKIILHKYKYDDGSKRIDIFPFDFKFGGLVYLGTVEGLIKSVKLGYVNVTKEDKRYAITLKILAEDEIFERSFMPNQEIELID